MIYKSKNGDINLDNLTRLYPAGVVDAYGEVAEMSLEWCEMNQDKIEVKEFVLVFDFTSLSADIKNKIVIRFKTKDELIVAMQEVSELLKD